jgi:hypothetical protein
VKLPSVEFRIQNAIITSATITNDDHGVLTAYVALDYGGACQSFGGYVLYAPEGFASHLGEANYAGHFIWRVMKVAGVSEWSELVGKTVRAMSSHSKVHALGHIVKDDWFAPSEDFERMELAKGSR